MPREALVEVELERQELERLYCAPERVATSREVTTAIPDIQLPSTVKPVYMKIIALHVSGMTISEISNILNLSPSTVSKAINHPGIREYKEQLADQAAMEVLLDARRIIQGHTAEAALTLVHHMRSETEPISLRASESILDRGGVPKAEVLHAASLMLEREDVESIRIALSDLKETLPELQEVSESHTVLAALRQEGNGKITSPQRSIDAASASSAASSSAAKPGDE